MDFDCDTCHKPIKKDGKLVEGYLHGESILCHPCVRATGDPGLLDAIGEDPEILALMRK